ncbi:MAG: hypothetical protein ABJK39_12100 [Hyphomicrobiales bacterium]
MQSLAYKQFDGDLDFAKSSNQLLSDEEATNQILNWMKRDLPCVAGRRETMRGRYMVQTAGIETVSNIFEEFKQKLKKREAVACLYIFNSKHFAHPKRTVSEVFYFLARQMQKISNVPPCALANGGALTSTIRLHCPVTGVLTDFDDFECIAFCPQSNNPDDPLYDPLLAMPLPAVNMSSDMYAFSTFVADMIELRYGVAVKDLSDDRDELEAALMFCVGQWQRVAAKTIQNYENITDTSICPVHLSAEQDQWVAGHKDPAFAEQTKEVHTHELPVLYCRRIVDKWLEHFFEDNEYSATGLARDGISIVLDV